MKLGNFFTGNVFTISQSPHGTAQNGKAIDAVPTSGTRVIAPCDMEIYYRKNDLGHQSYSYARGDGWKMVFVHCILEKQGHVKKGTDIGYLHTGGPVHLHVAIEVNGVWDVVLNYMDRSIQLALISGFSSQHWKSWSTWKDLQLKPISNPLWSIPREAYERGKRQFQPYVEKRRRDLIEHGVDTMEWLILHGTQELTSLIESLHSSLDGMTADRDKYAKRVAELESKQSGADKEIERLANEVKALKVEVEKLTHELLVEEQANSACNENTAPILKENEELRAKVETLNTELDKVIKAYAKKVEDSKGTNIDLKLVAIRIVRAIRKFMARNARDNS